MGISICIPQWLSLLALLLAVLSMDIIICAFAFYEAWGYSETGFKGIVGILGKKIEDHTIWKVLRFVFFLLPVLMFLGVNDLLQLALVVLSPGAKFLYLHQLGYNTTMYHLDMPDYAINVRESKRTTSTRTKVWFRVFCLIVGILMIPSYFIYLWI